MRISDGSSDVCSSDLPRDPNIPVQAEQEQTGKVVNYVDVLLHDKPVGPRVAVIGAGGIGFDVSEFLVEAGHSPTLDLAMWNREWGVADPATAVGGLSKPEIAPPDRQIGRASCGERGVQDG